MMPNPWRIIAALGVMLAAALAAYSHGVHTTKTACRLQAEQARAAANEARSDLEAKYRALEQQNAALTQQLDMAHREKEQQVDADYQLNSRLLSAGGLHDKNGTCAPARVPSAPPASSGASGAAPGCRLSEKTARDLLDLARDADLAAAYAQSGHAYAMSAAGQKERAGRESQK